MDIAIHEFRKMSVKEQNVILYQNTNSILHSQERMKFQQKVHAVIITILTGGLIYVGKLIFDIARK